MAIEEEGEAAFVVNTVQVEDSDDSFGRSLMMLNQSRATIEDAELHVRPAAKASDMLGALEAMWTFGEVGDFLAAAHACVEIDPDLMEVVAAFSFAGCGASRLNCREQQTCQERQHCHRH